MMTLNQLEKKIEKCRVCPELAANRTNTVFGDGNPNAKLMLLGEAPGADEDELKKPFVGRSGKLLDSLLREHGLDRSKFYVCNILKCRPPENRKPTRTEISNCENFLVNQIQIIKPKFILCLGSTSANFILENKLKISELRGKAFAKFKAEVHCTFHPAYLLRNPPAKKEFNQDLNFLLSRMGNLKN